MPSTPARLRHATVAVLCAAAWSALAAGCAAVPSAAPATSAPAPHVALGVGVREVGLIVEPRDGVRPLARAIRDATTSVWLTMYLLTDRTIIHDLEYAHAYGADVRVILEPHPYGMLDDPNRYAYNNLMAADIPVHWASPLFLLTHEKSMLVDNTAYIMSANFTYSAFRSNRDLGVVDRNPRDVAALRALFLADWRGRGAMPRDPNLPVSPSDARTLLTTLIGSAQHTLEVYAEELQDPAIVRVLSAATHRGVRVRIILPAPSGPDPAAAAVAAVTRAGAQVHRLPASYLYAHAKAIVADGQRAFVGSENLSAASLDRNRELGVIVADREAIATLQATFAADWRHQ